MKSVLVVLFLISAALSYEVSYEGHNVWSVTPVNEDHRSLLSKWQENEGIDFWESLGAAGKSLRIMVAPNMEASFISSMERYNVSHELLIENVEKTIQKESTLQAEAFERIAKLRVAGNFATDFNHFWTYTEINDYLNSLATTHGDICRSVVVGSSYNGRLIHALQISIVGRGEISGQRPIIFIDAGIHAREWAAPMTAIYAIYQMVEQRSFNDILQYVDVIVMPVVNPDGYEYSHQTNRFWRKTRRPSSAICYGIDGNRNYGYQWQALGTACSDTYSGTGPFSEPETQAVRSIIQRYGSQIKLYISLHSYGNYVLYPWGYAEIPISNWQHHETLGYLFANEIRASTGTVYSVGNSAILLYFAPGGSDDYAASEGSEAAFTIELPGGGSQGFDLPVNRLLPVVQETWLGLRRMFQYVATNN